MGAQPARKDPDRSRVIIAGIAEDDRARIAGIASGAHNEMMSVLGDLHTSLGTHINETRKGFVDLTNNIHAVDVRVARVEGAQGNFGKAAGIPVQPNQPGEKVRKPFWLVSQPKAFFGIAAAAATGAGGYKLIVAIALAIHHTLLAMAK